VKSVPILYVDNFRGFTDTYIPLADVNFLMGENSTGKSSILSLVNLLSSSVFWQNPSFNSGDIELGTYDEIANSDNSKKYIKIGIFDNSGIFPNRSSYYIAALLKFKKNDKGLPYVSEFSYIANNYRLAIAIDGKKVRYNVVNEKIRINENKVSEVIRFLKKWIRESDFDNNLKSANIVFENSPVPIPLSNLMYMFGMVLEGKDNSKKSSANVKESKELNIRLSQNYSLLYIWVKNRNVYLF